jgi:hypothetical protein
MLVCIADFAGELGRTTISTSDNDRQRAFRVNVRALLFVGPDQAPADGGTWVGQEKSFATQLQPAQMPSPAPTNLWHGLFIIQAGTGEENWTTLDDAQDDRIQKAGQGCVGGTNPYNISPPHPKRPPVVEKTCCMLGISATHAIFENPVYLDASFAILKRLGTDEGRHQLPKHLQQS